MTTPDHPPAPDSATEPGIGGEPDPTGQPLADAGDGTTFTVEVRRSIVCSVQVQAPSAEQAAERVNRRDFPLPEPDEWDALKDWSYVVYGPEGDELLEWSR